MTYDDVGDMHPRSIRARDDLQNTAWGRIAWDMWVEDATRRARFLRNRFGTESEKKLPILMCVDEFYTHGWIMPRYPVPANTVNALHAQFAQVWGSAPAVCKYILDLD